jgi:hypothetical protein
MTTKATILALCALTCFSSFGFYNPSTGRWLSRDPVTEELFKSATSPSIAMPDYGDRVRWNDPNPYSFLCNAIHASDMLGLLIFLETHPIPPTPLNHSKITMIVDCQSRFFDDVRFRTNFAGLGDLRYATIGAGPEDLGTTLVSNINRERDRNRSINNFSEPISLLVGSAQDDLIQRFFDNDARYNDNARYIFFPSPDLDAYNSNGYASGLLILTLGGIPIHQPPRTPGYEKPVPRRFFNR